MLTTEIFCILHVEGFYLLDNRREALADLGVLFVKPLVDTEQWRFLSNPWRGKLNLVTTEGLDDAADSIHLLGQFRLINFGTNGGAAVLGLYLQMTGVWLKDAAGFPFLWTHFSQKTLNRKATFGTLGKLN